MKWRTSSFCNTRDCVQVAAAGEEIRVGDSKTPDGPVLVFTPAEWQAFTEGVRDGEFDLETLR